MKWLALSSHPHWTHSKGDFLFSHTFYHSYLSSFLDFFKEDWQEILGRLRKWTCSLDVVLLSVVHTSTVPITGILTRGTL